MTWTLALEILLGAILVLVLVVGGYLAYFRHKSLPSEKQKKEDVRKEEKESKTFQTSSGHNSSGWAGKVMRTLLYLVVIAVGILIFIEVVGWVWGVFTHPTPTIKIVQPTAVVERTPEYVAPPANDVVSQAQTERFVLTLVYGEHYAWIRVPDGFRTWFSVDGKIPVDAQCSSSVEEPAIDATGPDYDCRDGVRPHWIRFGASNAEEGPVTVRYHFKPDSEL